MSENNDHVSLVESFSRYFLIEPAISEAQKTQVYGIRFRVYCEEFKYEAVDRFPERLERDDYDACSRHCLVIHRQSRLPAGCVRLVRAFDDQLLPLEKHCGPSLDREYIDSLALDRSTVCEISRLAVDGAFRRRTGEAATRFGEISGLHFSPEEQRTFSLIAVSCFLAATALTDMEGRTNVFAMMEPFLPRLMHRSGIDFHRAGKDMDYHGIRAPYFITTQAALINMHSELRALYDWIQHSLNTQSGSTVLVQTP